MRFALPSKLTKVVRLASDDAASIIDVCGSGGVAVFDALLAVWLLLVDDVQPATDKEATTSERTIIAVIGFSCILLSKKRMLA